MDPRLDAWRCFGDHFIYDPCFEDLAEEEFGVLLCVTSPWAKSGTLGFAALDYDDRLRCGGGRGLSGPPAVAVVCSCRGPRML